MTWSFVHCGTISASSTTQKTSPQTASTSVPSTAGNLAVLVLSVGGVSGYTSPVALPAAWRQAAFVTTSGSTGGGYTGIWYQPNCAAGISVQSFGWNPSSAVGWYSALMMEFHDDAGANAAPLDVIGSITSKLTTPVAIATSGPTTTAHELAISLFGGVLVTAAKDTVNPGTGFTQDTNANANNGFKGGIHMVSDYRLDTGAAGVTSTDSVTFGSSYDTAAGLIATFETAAVTPPALPVPLLGIRSPRRPRVVVPSRGQF